MIIPPSSILKGGKVRSPFCSRVEGKKKGKKKERGVFLPNLMFYVGKGGPEGKEKRGKNLPLFSKKRTKRVGREHVVRPRKNEIVFSYGGGKKGGGILPRAGRAHLYGEKREKERQFFRLGPGRESKTSKEILASSRLKGRGRVKWILALLLRRFFRPAKEKKQREGRDLLWTGYPSLGRKGVIPPKDTKMKSLTSTSLSGKGKKNGGEVRFPPTFIFRRKQPLCRACFVVEKEGEGNLPLLQQKKSS